MSPGESGHRDSPWEYNIAYRHHKVEMKRYFIHQLPCRHDTPSDLGKREKLRDGWFEGYLTDYAIRQVGPAEVTQAQIEEARPGA